ncbi:MAG TPA: peptide MFS transporter [Woeseiaceae bacterium]|nr:peptide MFS transporter [Woeseiaceae bacterium]
MNRTNGTLLGHPKGVFLVAGVEMWERFSYYAFVGLLPLFLVAAINAKGFGWDQNSAVRLFGLYSGLIFAAPAVGGWVASRFLGERNAIFWGAMLIFAGKIAMYFALVTAEIAGVESTFASAGIQLGRVFPEQVVLDLLAESAGPSAAAYAVKIYYIQAWLFTSGLVVTIVGTGLLKPAISSIVGLLYSGSDPRRESGFGMFMVGIWVGAFSSNLIAGTLGELYGWQYGFLAAAVGMSIGIVAYLSLQKRLLGTAGLRVSGSDRSEQVRPTLSITDYRKLAALAILSTFTVIYAAAYYQTGGILNLILKNNVHRYIGNFEVPATWFISITTGSFIIFTPLLMRYFLHRKQSLRPIDIVQKTALGLLCIAAGFILILCAMWSKGLESGNELHLLWFVVAYLFFGLGDAFIWPPQIAIASILAPAHLVSFVIGAWYVTVGLGSYLSGAIGALVTQENAISIFVAITITLMIAAAIAMLTRRQLLALMHGQEHPQPWTEQADSPGIRS